MPKNQTLKRLSNLRMLVDECRRAGDIDVYAAMERIDCGDSAARKYIAELVDARVLVFVGTSGRYLSRVYRITDDESVILAFVGTLSLDAPERQMPPPECTMMGYPTKQSKAGLFAQFQRRPEPVKVFRDPLVAAIFGPAGNAA